MYFKDISDEDLNSLPVPYAPNFTIKLSDILHKTGGVFDNKLFRIEEIITGSIYRIIPMFNCDVINGSNENDIILDDQCIIAHKETVETYFTFISDEDAEVQDYISYGSYYTIGDNLSMSEFNGVVSLLRANHSVVDEISIQDSPINSEYGVYDLDWTDTIVLDNGLKITSNSQLYCTLTNKQLSYSKYTLNLKALRIDNTNSEDGDTTDNKEVISVDVELINNETVEIPLTDLEVGDIILYGSSVTITHDLPVIPDIPKYIHLASDKGIIQTGEKADLTATVYDISSVETVDSGHDVYFYEAYEPTLLTLTSDKSIIQTSDKADLKATLKDEDGSLIQGEDIYFYVVEDE